jgi:hypothetical protein
MADRRWWRNEKAAAWVGEDWWQTGAKLSKGARSERSKPRRKGCAGTSITAHDASRKIICHNSADFLKYLEERSAAPWARMLG